MLPQLVGPHLVRFWCSDWSRNLNLYSLVKKLTTMLDQLFSYVASGFSAMLSVFYYTEFAVEVPLAGCSFSYMRVELGDFVAFTADANILLECVIRSATVAKSWTSYFIRFDSIATLVEETKNPSRNIPIDTYSGATFSISCISECVNEVGKLCGSFWNIEGDDRSASGGRVFTGTLYYSHCMLAHDPTRVCSCAP
ncbi:hypothetical protein Fmac_001566 [Flemingia macrophylla]|uniref:Uncharacterized protein n=1 Tax=Flemingia macrophylla TaxID=520843 RepID=A0ABD1NI19_9FABA